MANFARPIAMKDHVTDLTTGFSGVVIEMKFRLDKPTLLLVAPDRVALGRKLPEPRWIAEDRLRVDVPIRRRNAAAVPRATPRYTHPAQEEILAALWAFADGLVNQPQRGGALSVSGDLAVSKAHLEQALDSIVSATGYVCVGEKV